MEQICEFCKCIFLTSHKETRFCSAKCWGIWKKSLPKHRKDRIEVNGYIKLYRPQHPHSNEWGYIGEHRIVMEQKLGRLLTEKEIVHHIDGNRKNNNPENLELMPNHKFHNKFHSELRQDRITFICQWCGKEKTLKKSKGSIRKFCSKSCKGKWQWHTNHISNTFKRTTYLKQSLNKTHKEVDKNGIQNSS